VIARLDGHATKGIQMWVAQSAADGPHEAPQRRLTTMLLMMTVACSRGSIRLPGRCFVPAWLSRESVTR
jgi:hypothetical protein